MSSRRVRVQVPRALFTAASLVATVSLPAGEPTFYRNVQPILQKSCVGCHGGDSPKGKLSLESLESLQAGGKKGPPVVPGKAEESLLYLLASRKKKPAMPPKAEDSLAAADIDVIRAWIDAGAPPGEPKVEAAPYSRPLLPPIYQRPPLISALAYSTDGRRLFVAGYREILVVDAEPDSPQGASPRARLVGEAERLNALAVAPGGRWLAAAGGSPALFGELQVWNLETGALERFLRLGRDTLFAVAFSPDGSRIAVGGTDRTVHVLEAATLKVVFSAEVHSDWIFGVAFASDGTRIASASRDKTVKLVSAADGKFLGNLATFSEAVLSVVARPGTEQFLATGDGRQPVLLDAKESKEVRKFAGGAILAQVFSFDGKMLAAAGSEGEVRVYTADNGERKRTLRGSPEWIYAVAFRPDGERLATAGYEGIVRIYGPSDDKEMRSFVPAPMASSPDSRPAAAPEPAAGATAQ